MFTPRLIAGKFQWMLILERKEMELPILPSNDAVEISLIVPVYNEEEAVGLFCERVSPILESITPRWEVVFVNDGSSDKTIDALIIANKSDKRFKYIDFSRNFGKEIALTAGFDFVSGWAVIPMDVDLQDPPELIPIMVDKWREGFDMVLARRVDRSKDSWTKRSSASLFYKIMNKMSSIPLPDNVGDFRLLDQRVVAVLRQYRERQRFMKGLFASLGFSQAVVEYTRPERYLGTTKFRPLKLWALAVEGIISFSTRPLKIWTYIGIVCASFAAAYLMWIVFKTLIMGVDMPGYASLMSVMLFMNGIMLTGLGVIGEYVARIFNEVKGRPLYIVRTAEGDFRDKQSQPLAPSDALK